MSRIRIRAGGAAIALSRLYRLGAAATGQIGDGKIFVLDIVKAVRIRTGETDDDAL